MKLSNDLIIKRCPHCSVAMPRVSLDNQFETKDHSQLNYRRWGVYVCSSCGGVVTAWANDWGADVQQYFPNSTSVSEDVPEKPRIYLQQANDSLHAPAGAVMLSASAVDAMLKFRGLGEGSLYKRIELAIEQNILTSDMGEWAHEVRLDANDQRHADEDASLPTMEDARRALDYALALAEFLFILPNRVKRGISNAKS